MMPDNLVLQRTIIAAEHQVALDEAMVRVAIEYADQNEAFAPLLPRAGTVVPWFQDATIREITTVERPSPHHLYWPELDIELAVESIEHPDRFPLVSKARPNRALQRSDRRPARR